MEIRLDYATFNFDRDSVTVDSISRALSGDTSCAFRAKSIREGALLVSPFGLSYLDNSGWSPRPHRLQVSGVGCEKFYYTLPRLVDLCHDNGGDCSFSRLDFAFDTLMPDDDWRDFICAAFSHSLNSDRKAKKFSLSGKGLDMTVYIGSRVSDYYFRIYNKSLESAAKGSKKPSYVYQENGVPVDVPDGYSVIRYEIEMKRHVHHRGDVTTIFDPSQYFFDYYNESPSLLEEIRRLWLSFGDDVLLPPGFADAELSYLNKNKNFVQLSDDSRLAITQERVEYDYRQFNDTLIHIVTHFGKYIPFLVQDEDLYSECEYRAKEFCGFCPRPDPDRFLDPGLSDLDDACEVPFEPCQLHIESFGEEVNFDAGSSSPW